MTKTSLRAVIAAVLFAIAAMPLQSQTSPSAGESIALPDLPKAQAPDKDQVGGFNPSDYRLLKDYSELLDKKARFDLEQHINIYRHQYAVSVIIFIINLALLAIGVLMSYMHFRMDIKARKSFLGAGSTAKPETPTQPQEPPVTEIDWVGLKIKSSVIGLIILFISLLYFYLYLVFVYPIT